MGRGVRRQPRSCYILTPRTTFILQTFALSASRSPFGFLSTTVAQLVTTVLRHTGFTWFFFWFRLIYAVNQLPVGPSTIIRNFIYPYHFKKWHDVILLLSFEMSGPDRQTLTNHRPVGFSWILPAKRLLVVVFRSFVTIITPEQVLFISSSFCW